MRQLMRRSDFNYPLPAELIAQAPLAQRSASRLLVLDGSGGTLADRQMRELPGLLRRPLEGNGALAQLRASNSLRAGETLATAGGPLRLQGRQEDLWELLLPEPAVEFFERYGTVPLPPYIARAPDALDRERYQSLFAQVPGAVAAPTASLHFDAELLAALTARGIARATVTLHVGAGTFQPLRAEQLEGQVLHAEWYSVPAEAMGAIEATRAVGGRVIAVGTTVARALESTLATGVASGDTRLFIRPGFAFEAIDGLITNFHLPGSTLLMLVAALAGHEAVLAAYAHAVAQRYRFFSYGDAMLVWPAPGVRL